MTWGVPLAIERASVPAFPTDALAGVTSDFVCDVAEAVQVPVDLVAVGLLATTHAAVATRARISIGRQFDEPLNLWVLAIAGSGERKGPTLRALVDPIRLLQNDSIKRTKPTRDEAVERRAIATRKLERLRKLAAEKDDADAMREAIALAQQLPAVPPEPKFIVDDRTSERLEVDLAENPALLLSGEEAGKFFAIAQGRYHGDRALDVDSLLKAYDGGPIDVARMNREAVYVPNPALSICLTPQPSVLTGLRAAAELRDRGFLARFLFAWPASYVGGRRLENGRPANARLRDAYADVLARLYGMAAYAERQQTPCLRIDGDAYEAFRAYANRVELDQNDGGHLAAHREWASKQAGRVAGLRACCTSSRRSARGSRGSTLCRSIP